ncbi:hypothetical protein [Vibrio marisflavi]|uniref:Uncharacterized protein n=1 Tax=Vibrio marisflavi CECT 7928 TaxID=634439 RepID=A0ABN8E6N6_9VIBR|nr:hypothetical protein [Vibrio marisflavi]CAH0539492.1 hypothetical protein VMF7928_02188 [Vibrio marisflavi CECT 7928]
MNRLIATLLVSSVSFFANAADTVCLEKKYDAYVDASLDWYSDLTQLTNQRYPDLVEVSEWFLQGRKHHFELNEVAVAYYLKNDPSKVATEQPVEKWLQLEQKDIKQLTERDDELGQAAKLTYQDRQSAPHPDNYHLRSAFADLLSNPKQINDSLQKYNTKITKIEEINCE